MERASTASLAATKLTGMVAGDGMQHKKGDENPTASNGRSVQQDKAAGGNFTYAWVVGAAVLLLIMVLMLPTALHPTTSLYQRISNDMLQLQVAHPNEAVLVSHFLLAASIALLCWGWYGKRPVYLVDFYCFRPPNHLQVANAGVVRGCELTGIYNEKSMDFIKKITEMSGLSDQTFFPEEVRRGAEEDMHEKLTYDGARLETEAALFISIEKLLAQTGMHPKQVIIKLVIKQAGQGMHACLVDAVIVNCCSMTTVPSFASAVVNHFKLKSSVLSYNLSGMGCTATVIAAELANELLQNHKNMRVLVASSDNISSKVYLGNQRSMMITNLIFRYGGAAFLMSNHPADKKRSKYLLNHVVRTNMAANDDAYRCVLEQTDDDGKLGVKIGKELMNVAGKSMAINIRILAPLVLPLSEKLKYAHNLLQRKVLKKQLPDYQPDFSKAFDHFCIHTGGKAVIEAVEKNLKLKAGQGEPCRATFHRYGNTSSTSTWYNWSYVETMTGVKKGDKVWQLSFGSGFKVASAVWTALRPISVQHDSWTETPSC